VNTTCQMNGKMLSHGAPQMHGGAMMVVFFFLGAAAGMLNVYRAATGRGLAVGYGKGTREPGEQNETAGAGPENGMPQEGAADKDRGGKR